jgi:hypothetical protein
VKLGEGLDPLPFDQANPRMRTCPCREDASDVASSVGAAGVDDPVPGVPALAAEAFVEADAETAQLCDADGRLLGQQLDRARPAKTPARGDGVGSVQRRVVARADGSRDASLGDIAVRVAVRRLGDHDHGGACVGCLEGCGQAGDACPDHGDVARLAFLPHKR